MKPRSTLMPLTYSRIQELGDDLRQFMLAINSEWRENYNFRLVLFLFHPGNFPTLLQKRTLGAEVHVRSPH